MKEAEELLNKLDNWHKDFRPNRLRIVEQFLEQLKIAPEPRKPREFIVNVYSDGSISSAWARQELQIEQIKVREVID